MQRRIRPVAAPVTAVRFAAAAMLLGFTMTACDTDEILTVDDVDVPTTGSLTTKQNLPILLAGAVGDFEAGYQGSGLDVFSGIINTSGLLSDEIRSTDTPPERNQVDQRSVTLVNNLNLQVFFRVSRARQSADFIARKYAELDPTNVNRALALALSGFATVLLGETYCSGVPFSSIDDAGVITYGQPLPTDQIWPLAIGRFDEALATPGITAQFRNLAAIGKGRALLNGNQFAQAAAAVAAVPAGFTYLIESSATTTRQNNGVWFNFIEQRRLSVPNREGTNGLNYREGADPRVPFASGGIGFDNLTPQFRQTKYPARDSDTPLATSAEARLIEAEAALRQATPDIPLFLAKLNAARAEFPGLAPLTLADIPATQPARVDLLFRERAFALWLTAHRLGDLRRLIRQHTRTAAQVFPTGTWTKGPDAAPATSAPYGPDVNLPVPQAEENNPNFTGCINRDA
ncbi:MAG: hypothetical protein ACREON_11650 [Gemmatimonadaceae bacterium]